MIRLPDRWQFYKDKGGLWQWRKYGDNKVVAVSYESYYSRQACVKNAKTRGYVAEVPPDPRAVHCP